MRHFILISKYFNYFILGGLAGGTISTIFNRGKHESLIDVIKRLPKEKFVQIYILLF